jgi:hypothetical protein
MDYNYVNDYTDSDGDNYGDDYTIYTIMTIIMGILLGSIIGYFIFRDIKYIGPDSNEIVKQIYTDSDGKKYKYKPHITICPLNYSMKKLHDPDFKESH